jgi:hypothetical protein
MICSIVSGLAIQSYILYWFVTHGEYFKQPTHSQIKEPQFIGIQNRGVYTYEVYQGRDAESAKTFLQKKRVDGENYYILIETPEGNWGMDIKGLFLENLLPWQVDIDAAVCDGRLLPTSSSQFGLTVASQGILDNFIAKVECGKCEHQWLDGLRYQNNTVVRCPNCKMLNKIDSRHLMVVG